MVHRATSDGTGIGAFRLRLMRLHGVENLTRVQVKQAGKAGPLIVTVTLDGDEAFKFDRRPVEYGV